MICFTPKEYQDLQDQTKKILEDTVKQAVKDATIKLLADKAADAVEIEMWKTKYDVLYNDYIVMRNWNIAGWSVAGAEGIALFVKFITN